MSIMWILKFQEKQSYLELWSLISLYGTGTQNVTFIRSAHEQSNKNRSDWERVQKTAVRVIMGNNYKTYIDSLKMLKLDSLEWRREKLCLQFAKKCTTNEKLRKYDSVEQNK